MSMEQYVPRVEGHAMVLGGSGGIGSEIVRALLANGASAVSFTYSSRKAVGEALAAELSADGHRAAAFALRDLHDAAAVDAVLAQAVAWAGEEITTGVNTVGISPNTELEAQTPDEWRRVQDINVTGNFFAARTLALRMRAQGVKGALVLLSSDNATVSWSPISAHYDASKAAVELNVRHLAFHFARDGIRVNGVAPGWVETSMNDSLPADERADVYSRIWLGRFARPAEIASVVAFVAGRGASFMTGTVVVVNGGFR
ncbi:MAG TPA: SDR family oxidoreductase [Burkholderiales bacterium]